MTDPLARQRWAQLAGALALSWAAGAANPALATGGTFNVSQLVLGTQQAMPASTWFGTPCGSACRYASVSGTQMSNGYGYWPGDYSHAVWPVFPASPMPTYSSVQDNLALTPPPAGSAYAGLATGVLQRSRVAFSPVYNDPASARQLDVQTFKSGNGVSALSYAVRIEAPAGTARPTFLRFAVPTLVRDGISASHLGGSGNQPIVTWPKRLQARSAVDVYVDGLPVWSSATLRLLPQRYKPDTPGDLRPSWGPTLNGGEVTLFLGNLPAGSVRSAVIVMRSDLRVDAPTCFTENHAFGTDLRRCDAQIEGLQLPSRSVAPWYIHSPDIAVYAQ